MAQIKQLEAKAEKATAIFMATWKEDNCRNAVQLKAYQLQLIDEYLRKADELKKQLNTSSND